MPDGEFCVTHDPSRIADLTAYRRKGGHARSNKARALKDLPAEPLTTAEAHAYLSLAFRRALVGKMDAPMLNALSTAAKALADLSRTVEQDHMLAELAAKVTRLERRGAS